VAGIILVGLSVSAITINFLSNSFLMQANVIQQYEGLIAIIAVVITVATFIIARWIEWNKEAEKQRDILKKSCNALLEEIRDHRFAFYNPEYDSQYVRVYKNQDKSKAPVIEYIRRIFNIDSYESVLYSGLFTHFSTDTQHSLSTLYLKIKLRNSLLRYMNDYYDRFFLDGNESDQRFELFTRNIIPYEKNLTAYEKEIKKSLNEVEQRVKDELPS
jgi:hypothetical protein